MRFFGLLHLSDSETTTVNEKLTGFRDQITLYLKNAVTLSNSLRAKGFRFTVLTNQEQQLRNFHGGSADLEFEEIEFNLGMPSGAGFYSAHFKLDVLRHLSRLDDAYLGLVDLDMICLNPVPDAFNRNVREGIPMCYDISDQVVPAFGEKTIIRDLEALHGGTSEGRW